MAEKKQSIMALLDILERYSDEDHILTIKDIQAYLASEYHTELDRRTLYTHMDILSDFGFEVSRFEDNHKGYYLMQRRLEKGEVLLLCNAIHASHFISASQSDQLIKKLLNTQSRFQQKEFKDKVYMPNRLKTRNRQMMYNIEIVSEAIRDNRQLSFTYLHYDTAKQLVPRRPEPYIVEPRYIVYADSRPYMITTMESHDGYTHYRLDRMADPKVLSKRSRPLNKDQDAYEYARNRLFMYTGELLNVTFRCRIEVIDQMIDIFGSELKIESIDEGHFLMKVKTSQRAACYLAQQFMEYVQIEEPSTVRESFIQTLEQTLQGYR